MQPRQPPAPERGVHLASTKPATDGLTCTGVTPRRTEWLPALLAALRPYTINTLNTYSTTQPWRTSTALCSRLHPGWTALDTTWTDDTAEAVAYIHAITALASTDTDERSTYHQHRHDDLIDTTESIGTGRGPVNAGLGALAKGPVALHRALDLTPRRITLVLDGTAWTSLEDRRTGVRALATIAVLAHGFCVQLVVSPALRRHLAKRYPNWTDAHVDRPAGRERSPHERHHGTDAWTAIQDLESHPTKRRLLGCLADSPAQSYADLTDLDIADGTVSRYVCDLETRGLVAVDRRGTHHTVQLTSLGQTAVERCLTDSFELRHPNQRHLGEHLTGTPQQSTSTVSPCRAGGETPTPDEWVAATGDPDEDAD